MDIKTAVVKVLDQNTLGTVLDFFNYHGYSLDGRGVLTVPIYIRISKANTLMACREYDGDYLNAHEFLSTDFEQNLEGFEFQCIKRYPGAPAESTRIPPGLPIFPEVWPEYWKRVEAPKPAAVLNTVDHKELCDRFNRLIDIIKNGQSHIPSLLEKLRI